MWQLAKTEWRYQGRLLAFIYTVCLLAFAVVYFALDGNEPKENFLPGLMLLGALPGMVIGPILWNRQQQEKRLRLWGLLPFSKRRFWHAQALMVLAAWVPSTAGVCILVARNRGSAMAGADLLEILAISGLILALILFSRLIFDLFRLKSDSTSQIFMLFFILSNSFGQRNYFVNNIFEVLAAFFAWPLAAPLTFALTALTAYLWQAAFVHRRDLA